MTFNRLFLRSLLFYWRTNLAVLLGVVAAVSVIAGALIVGDSVRESLRAMTLQRLGKIDFAVSGHRFFREELADELNRATFKDGQAAGQFAPALSLRAGLTHATDDTTTRVGDVNLFGVDERLWNLCEHGDFPPPADREIILNQRTADNLQVKVGDELSVWIEVPETIPRESLLGDRDETTRELTLTVAHILPPELGVGRLDLNPSQQLPLTAFVALDSLQETLDLAEVRPSRRDPQGAPARINSLYISAAEGIPAVGPNAPASAVTLTGILQNQLQPSDLGLILREHPDGEFVSLESQQMILESALESYGRDVAKAISGQVDPVLVYIANEIARVPTDEDNQPAEPAVFSMYGVVAGLDLAAKEPFGEFTFVGPRPKLPLADDEVVINEWLAEDLRANVGDRIRMTYHLVGSHGELPEEAVELTVKGIVKLEKAAADRSITPEVKGITDAETFADWEQPFPMDLGRITPRDEKYWDMYRATPKAFLSLAQAQKLWSSRYGKLTSLRIAGPPGMTLGALKLELMDRMHHSLDLQTLGLAVLPVKWQGLQAASGTTDFAGLFIGFSFFLILSAAVLVGLMFRLGVEQRSREIGLLSAIGFRGSQVRRVMLSEAACVLVVGSVVGGLTAIGYAQLMVYGLKTWWVGAIGTRFLGVSVTPQSLVVGESIGLVVAAIAVWWAMRELRRVSTRDLLMGNSRRELTASQTASRSHWNARMAGIEAFLAVGLLVAVLARLIPSQEAFSGFSWQVVSFFLVGVLLLACSWSSLGAVLDSDVALAVKGAGLPAVLRLGARNAARNRSRSVMTAGLISSAAFVIVAVAAGRQDPVGIKPDLNSGNGGFTLVAEASTPLVADLNTVSGRAKLNLDAKLDDAAKRVLGQAHSIPFRMKPGEDASCLNLYQTHLPTVLGATPEMMTRGGFQFADTPGKNPWKRLEGETENGRIPVLGDMNTLMYSLHKGIGDTVAVPNEDHPEYILEIVGMFAGSIFQGTLVMSEANFERVFPEQSGYAYFLIETPPNQAEAAAAALETGLASYGFDAELVAVRLADFMAVQNTYLSTFQSLGGLGLLLGTLGLAAVMLRNVLERRPELALMRAVGFRVASLAWLVLAENAFLLTWGLLTGSAAALLAMLPHLLSSGADPSPVGLLLTLGSVLVVGMLAALVAVRQAVRIPIVAALRQE